jgi:hypothetical protein
LVPITAASPTQRLWKTSLALAGLTIVFNLIEGVVSTGFDVRSESLALLGFGFDSPAEVFSGLGVLLMIVRITRNPITARSNAELLALDLRVLRLC